MTTRANAILILEGIITRNEALKAQYNALRSQYCGSVLTDKHDFDVELLSRLINSLKRGKAAVSYTHLTLPTIYSV